MSLLHFLWMQVIYFSHGSWLHIIGRHAPIAVRDLLTCKAFTWLVWTQVVLPDCWKRYDPLRIITLNFMDEYVYFIIAFVFMTILNPLCVGCCGHTYKDCKVRLS